MKVTNFPPGYPWYKRYLSNITYWFSLIPLWPRRNDLTRADIQKFRSKVQDGDIVLCGNFQHISGIAIKGIVTHAIVHLSKGKCIHAFAQGVSLTSLRKIFRTYDTLILLRPRWENTVQKNQFRKSLIDKLGKPYDFFFGLGDTPGESYFCTRLVNDCLLESGYLSRLDSIGPIENIVDRILDKTFRAHRVLTPESMIYGNFDVIFYSHNLILQENMYTFRDKYLGKIILDSRYKDIKDRVLEIIG